MPEHNSQPVTENGRMFLPIIKRWKLKSNAKNILQYHQRNANTDRIFEDIKELF